MVRYKGFDCETVFRGITQHALQIDLRIACLIDFYRDNKYWTTNVIIMSIQDIGYSLVGQEVKFDYKLLCKLKIYFLDRIRIYNFFLPFMKIKA